MLERENSLLAPDSFYEILYPVGLADSKTRRHERSSTRWDFLSQVLSLWLPYLLTWELLNNYSSTFKLRLR